MTSNVVSNFRHSFVSVEIYITVQCGELVYLFFNLTADILVIFKLVNSFELCSNLLHRKKKWKNYKLYF